MSPLMASSSTLLICFTVINLAFAKAKVYMVLMEDEPSFSVSNKQKYHRDIKDYFSTCRAENDYIVYKEKISNRHTIFLESHLRKGSYTKLYSYTHLLNGFAVHVTSEEVLGTLRNATGVRLIHEDVKIEKLTTHTPDFLGISTHVWPRLGGAESSGEGVVIGFVDTGINPDHPSFVTSSSSRFLNSTKFKGKCISGEQFPSTACNGKIVGAQYFAHGAMANGEFNATRDIPSPYDADGHGRQVIHTASIAAGINNVSVVVNGFDYGTASGMAPGARIAVYKAIYAFGGYMSDVVAAVDQAVEDGVDILSLSAGPSSVPSGDSAFLNVLELQLLFAIKAGVLVVQAAGNGGPFSSSVISFSPWITSVAASITDRKYNNTILLGNGQSYSGSGISPPTEGEISYQVAAAADVCVRNATTITIDSCQNPEPFIRPLAYGKLIICTYTFEYEYESASIAAVADTMKQIGAAGFIITLDPNFGSAVIKGTMVTLQIPAIILNDMQASSALWEYYNSNTVRDMRGQAIVFAAKARILDGRQAIYTGQAPVVASYSSRGPDVQNALMQTADVLKPNVMAPGSSIWAAWSPDSDGDKYIKGMTAFRFSFWDHSIERMPKINSFFDTGQNFALISGTSMATPHIAGIAALIKQKHPKWGPDAITSAMMTTADRTDHLGAPILAESLSELTEATPFDFGAGSINASQAIKPGLIFNATFKHYVAFLCAVPGLDREAVKRAVGVSCPTKGKFKCSDLNTASVTISNLVGKRKVIRYVKNVSDKDKYTIHIKEPLGVNVTVVPETFKIKRRGSRRLRLLFQATETTNAYTFGEMVLKGKQHTVRVPLAVYVASASTEFLHACPSSIEDTAVKFETAVHISVKSHSIRALKVVKLLVKNVKNSNGLTAMDIFHAQGTKQNLEIQLELKRHRICTSSVTLRDSFSRKLTLIDK
ncbi:hypothetical protein GQ457_07G010890 [Hibiscus cannabinus]